MSSPCKATAAIEALRSGIPSATVSELFSSGQDAVHQQYQALLDQGFGAMVVQGDYGQGKTHLLKTLVHAARRRGYVTSLVCLSKETPFNHWWHLYAAAVRTAETPDGGEMALDASIGRWRWSDEPAQELVRFASEHLHPRVATVLEAYFRTSEPSAKNQLVGDLRGHQLANPVLKKLFADVTGLKKTKLPAAKLRRTGADYFAMAGKLFRLAGYSGWAVFFDEFELVGKLGIQARSVAYANLGTLLQEQPRPGFDSIVTTFTTLPSYVTEYIVDGKCDLDTVPKRLAGKGLPEEAGRAEYAMRFLAEKSVPLRNLTEAEVREVLDRIAALHGEAYGWRPPEGDFYVPDPSVAQKMRTAVRYAVERLDLALLYGEIAEVRTEELQGPELAEDQELFAGAESEREPDPCWGDANVSVVDVDM